ncbi:unnamed protein product [Camellia sinensis]
MLAEVLQSIKILGVCNIRSSARRLARADLLKTGQQRIETKAQPTCNNSAQHILKLNQAELKDDNKEYHHQHHGTESGIQQNSKGTAGVAIIFFLLSLLNMEGCLVIAACLDSLAAIPALLYLNLSRCDFSDDGCEKSSGLRNLKVLNLGFNDISDACLVQMRGIIDGVLCNNSQLYLGNGWINSPTTGSVTTTVAEKQRLASLVLLSIIRKA